MMKYMVHKILMSDVENIKGGNAERDTILYRVISLNFEWEPEKSKGGGHVSTWGRAVWSNGTKLYRP